MERFNQLPLERRRAIFEGALDAGLTAEGIADPSERAWWKEAMRAVVVGGHGVTVPENDDVNPYMLAGENGGKFRGGGDRLNSSAVGYFQFLSTGNKANIDKPSEEWQRFAPAGATYEQRFDPEVQARWFINAVRQGGHRGDPWSVVRDKSRGDKTWGPWGPKR